MARRRSARPAQAADPSGEELSSGQYPNAFVWGAATSAFQVEGATRADGRGESIWDRFCAQEGKIRAGDTAEVACDFYNRYREDVELMRVLGLDAFRFSVAWPRVVPTGRGRVNPRGLDFYDRLVDVLLEAGIEPFPTLYHWDLPQALEDNGGWTRRETAESFVEYAEQVVIRLGDRVTRWTTHNEPWAVAWLGYGHGWLAPGRADKAAALAAAHHLLLSHGWAAAAIRELAPGAEVGIALNLGKVEPATEHAEDLRAAWAADGRLNRWFLDPVLRGTYPADVVERFAPVAPPVCPGDLQAISTPIDFLGVNYYTRYTVRADRGDDALNALRPEDAPCTEMGWEIHPQGLRDVLVRVHREYDARRLYVFENGAAFTDVLGPDGEVRDPERCAFLQAHVNAVGDAIAAGAPVAGYFVWSLLDNFEWAEGYRRRFGLIYVVYRTQERIPKASFDWYRRLIASHRAAGRFAGAVVSGVP